MKVVTLTELKSQPIECIEACEKNGPVIVTRHGKAIAIIRAPADDEEMYRIKLAHSPKFQAMIERSRQSIREGRVYSSEEFWKLAEERARKREQAKKRKTRKPA